MGYCPMLENLSLSYCSLIQVKSLVGAPNLREYDCSFNSVQSLEHLLNSLKNNHELRTLRFNDNTFSLNKD
jgi:Leucine-rich repeat (LRR) protein